MHTTSFIERLTQHSTTQNVPEKIADIVKGVCDGCVQSGAALIGGETAEMPGMYEGGEYDIAGFTTGVVEKSKLIDGSKVKTGDVLVGIASSGVHSNGFSLVRKIVADFGLKYTDSVGLLGGRKLGDVLLTPTKIYVKQVLKTLTFTSKDVKQLTNTTMQFPISFRNTWIKLQK